MENAFAWLRDIAEWLGRFVPRWVILDTTEGAIKYKGGRTPVVCGPGVHFYWPARSTFVPYPIARQTDRLETQTMETADGITFMASGTLTHEIEDLGLLVPRTHSPSTTIVDLPMAAVHDICSDETWAYLNDRKERRKLKTQLKNAAQEQLKDYGVKVHKLQLNSLVRCRAYKISQSTSTEEN